MDGAGSEEKYHAGLFDGKAKPWLGERGGEAWSAFGMERKKGGALHESMRKADFGTIHGAISSGFEDGKETGIVGIQKDVIDSLLAER